MVRTALTAAVAVALMAPQASLTAQDYTWDNQRPDAHAPLGLLGDLTLDRGEVLLSYRYTRDGFAGVRLGEDRITSDDVFDFDFTVAPATMDIEAHEVELRYGLSNDLTLAVSAPFTLKEMLSFTDDGDTFFITEANTIGDVEVRFLYDLFQMGMYRAHLTIGSSIPTGKTDDTDITAASFPNEAILPFRMQGGSGTFDVLPGLTLQAQNEHGTVGASGQGVFRIGDNDRGYTLGDRFEGSVWGSVMLNEWMSTSVRVVHQAWGDVEGFDPATDPNADPTSNPFSTGGSRTSLPFGLNILMQEGPLAGIRLAVEWYYVVAEDLHGPQLSQDDRLVVGWQYAF